MNSICKIESQINEITKHNIGNVVASEKAKDFNAIIALATKTIVENNTDIELVDAGTKILLTHSANFELVKISGFGDVVATGGNTQYEAYDLEWNFVAESGVSLTLNANIRDLAFDGDEVQSWSLECNGETSEDLIVEGEVEDALDKFMCSDYTSDDTYDRNRSELSQHDIDVISQILGISS
jgi:hypothetical protein